MLTEKKELEPEKNREANDEKIREVGIMLIKKHIRALKALAEDD